MLRMLTGSQQAHLVNVPFLRDGLIDWGARYLAVAPDFDIVGIQVLARRYNMHVDTTP